jgi:polyferredoxin/formate hydrogenlyase subunit 6/NADH:ubiquinone oxidoreductase subunit I
VTQGNRAADEARATEGSGAADERQATPPGGRVARRSTGGWKGARWARRATQIATFVVFLYLIFAGVQRVEPLPHAGIFFLFDPLAAVATMLAARTWLPDFALALVTVALAVVVGRVWCGWICPLGTLLGWCRFRSADRRARRVPPALRSVKYVLLGVVLVLAAFAILTPLVLDPIALLTRSVTTSVVPALAYLVDTLETAGMRWEPTVGTVTWVEDHFRGTVLPAVQPHFEQAVALFLVLLAVILLNAFAHRFWCRYLCPLGALLGLVAKTQVLRPVVGDACDGCAACARACGVDAIELAPQRDRGPDDGGATAGVGVAVAVAEPRGPATARVVTSECTMCLDCLVACPRPGAMSFGTGRPGPWERYDPGRREVVVAAATGVGAALLFGAGVARAVTRPGPIRPPGAQDEARFLSRCLRCSECMKVCPTSGLQPTLLEAGLEGLWTPVLKSRLGYCDYACTACGQVCPSGAIPELGLEEKRRQVIGVAVIDRERCLPWAADTPCIVCQEMCPVPDKAIELLGERLITRPDGSQDYLSRPKVVPRRCIGCGICEFKCPVEGTAAIVVVPWSSGHGRRRAGWS